MLAFVNLLNSHQKRRFPHGFRQFLVYVSGFLQIPTYVIYETRYFLRAYLFPFRLSIAHFGQPTPLALLAINADHS